MYTLVSPQITVFFIVALAFAPSAMAVSKVSPMPSAMSLTGGSSKAASGHGTPMLQIHSFTQPAETVLSFAQKSPDLMSTVKAMVKQKLGVELRAEIDGSFSKRFGEMMHAEGKFCKSESDIVVSKGYVNSSFRPSQDELDRGYMALANGSLQPLSNPEVLDVLYNKAGAGIEIDLGSMESESCLVRRDGNLLFAKDVVFRDHNLGGMPMRAKVLANGEIEVQPGYFHASGSVDAYEQNPIDTPTETTFNYSDFSDSSFFLDSDQFSTVIFSGDRAESSTRDFSGFASGSQELEEANTFVHAREVLSTYTSAGFSYYGAAPMQLYIREPHPESGERYDNAFFVPEGSTLSTTGGHEIHLGQGTGTGLRNLGLDVDVVAHELGHFVVFETLKAAFLGTETLVLHEGLADALANQNGGDPCVAESVCPSGSGFCAVPNMCLRTADNDLMIENDTYDMDDHHGLGQVISGGMWDLREKGVPANTLTSLIIDAVELLVYDSGYRDLFLALLTADRNNYSGAYAAAICQVASERGFDSYLEDVSCPSPGTLPAITGLSGDFGTDNRGQLADSQSSSCGVIGMNASQGHKSPWLLLCLIPFVGFLMRSRKVHA